MSDTTWPHVLNLSNSIIGVTVLAMPFCFKECGVLLGVVLLFFSTWLTLTSCQLLMKAGIISRRRSYGFLAYYTHGAPGKFAVEVGMIGLQIGTLIAQVVIIGDLGPGIISKVTGLQNSSNLRTALIIILCFCIGLPLGLLKNLTTLSHASTLCILFYTTFVIYVMFLATPNLFKGDWINKVNLWRTEGLFKCLPIFSFAFGCQTQLFILYDALAEPSLKAMNSIVGSAVNMCTVAYLLVGFFGYVAFCDIDVSGDIITHFDASVVSDVLKLGFVISIAISFPLIIYPCRNSLYTMLFPQKQKQDENIEPQRPVIPELHFKAITVAIVIGAMITGILVPNVEFVLAMNGATMGTLICYIFPAMFFLRVMTTSSDGKSLAQLVFIFGFTIMLLCTYTTLNSQDVGHIQPAADIMDKPKLDDIKKPVIEQPQVADLKLNKDDDDKKKREPPDKVAGGGEPVKDDTRIEPPNPKEPVEEAGKTNKDSLKKSGNKLDGSQTTVKKLEDKLIEKVVDDKVKEIKKEVEKAEKVQEEVDKKQKDLLKQLENQQKESKKLLEEQKQILEELKQHKEEVHKQGEKVEPGQPLVQQQGQQEVVQQPVLGQGQQVVQQPGGNQGQQQVAQQPVLGQGQQVVQQPGGNQGQQQVAQQPALGQGQQVVQQPGGNQGQQQVAQHPALGQGQQVVQQPGVNQGQQHVAQQQALGQGQQVVQQPGGNQGQQQVAQQPALGQGQQVVQQPGVNQGQQQVAQQPVLGQGQQVAQQSADQIQQAVQQNKVNQGQQPAGEGHIAQQLAGQGQQVVQQQPVAQQGMQQQVAAQGQQQVGVQGQQGQVGLQAQKQQVMAQGQNQAAAEGQQQIVQKVQQQPAAIQGQQQQLVAQGQQGVPLKQQAVVQGQQQNNQQQNIEGQQQANNLGGKNPNGVQIQNEKAQIAEDKSKLQQAMNEIQKVLDEVQKDKPYQEDKPLNRQKRDTDNTNNKENGQKETHKGNIDDSKKGKNDEMRRKKLSFDEGGNEDDQLLYEALKNIDKRQSHHPVVGINAFRSLKYKDE